jgi:hypothetical protein
MVTLAGKRYPLESAVNGLDLHGSKHHRDPFRAAYSFDVLNVRQFYVKRLSVEKEQRREGYVLWVEAATFLSVAKWDR